MTDGTTGQDRVFSIRPTFVGWATVAGQIPYHPVLALFALVLGVFLGAAMSEPPDRTISYSDFLLPPAVMLAVSPFILFHAKRRRYRKKEYHFFRDRLQLGDGYVFYYRNVESLTMCRGLLGRISGLGTLRFKANIEGFAPLFARNGRGIVTMNGIVLKDIPDPEQALLRIQALIDAQRR